MQRDVAGPFAAVRLPDVWDGPPYANYALELPGATLLAVWPRRGMFEDHDAAAETTARALAVLPPAVIRALPPDAVLVYDSAVTTYGSFEPPSGIAFHPDSPLDEEFEEGVLHEIGHVLDARMGSVSERASCRVAREKDQSRHVSGYAETDDAEDFAESFVAWAAYRCDLARPVSARRTNGRATQLRAGADQVPDGVVRLGADGRRQHA